jgi:hypothetical protein
MIRKGRILLLLMFLFEIAAAQQSQFVYENKIYQNQIKTVQCFNAKKEQSFPIIALKSSEQISFSFDDLDGGSKNYWYTVEHCTSDWQSSRLSALNYLDGMTDDRIVDYQYSSNTLQRYTHYAVNFPNAQIKFKISGNYLLKIYLDGDLQKPVISQRFYVLDNQLNIGVDIQPSNQVSLRQSNQKINFTIFHTAAIQNPYTDVRAVVMQNGNPLNATQNTKPTYIKPGALVYNEINSNDFAGNYEFRKVDFRSFRYKSEHVQSIVPDSLFNILLFPDLPPENSKYSNQFDENGAFYIRNQDERDPNTESDYANVFFSLNAKQPTKNGIAYVVGQFNNYTVNEQSKLEYDPLKSRFYKNLLLKQGVYDYKYIWKDKGSTDIDESTFEGSYFETGNTYQVLVYFHKPGSRWEELLGFGNVNTIKP